MNKEATMKVSLQLKLTHTRHATSIGPGNIVIYDERVKSTSLDKFKSIVDCFWKDLSSGVASVGVEQREQMDKLE